MWAWSSVAEVQFWTDAENWNRLNRTDSSVQFRFSPATPVVSSVLSSQILKILRTGSGPVRTGPNHNFFERKSPGNFNDVGVSCPGALAWPCHVTSLVTINDQSHHQRTITPPTTNNYTSHQEWENHGHEGTPTIFCFFFCFTYS